MVGFVVSTDAMHSSKYVFKDTQQLPELKRLQAIEGVFDPATQSFLQRTRIGTGWKCLEVGAGAGSVARWMSTQVGSTGLVVALDRDTRFLRDPQPGNVVVVEGDILSSPLEAESFDLVHARYVLIHIPQGRTALQAILHHLKPGGWLVLEEPDFLVARALAGEPAQRQAFEKVHQAIAAMFSSGGMKAGFGASLPTLLQEQHLLELSLENDAPMVQGDSPLAQMMRMSAVQLGSKYLQTGMVTENDLDLYRSFTVHPSSWAIYYATVRGMGRKPGLG